MGVPPSRRTPRNPRQGQVREGRRQEGARGSSKPRFRIVVAETTTTAYRKHWIGDDGVAAARGDPGVWPVYHGKSFELWNPDTGDYYDSCEAEIMIELLQERRRDPQQGSPHHGFSKRHLEDSTTLACRRPRIAVRDITNPTNTRTLIAALIPPDRILPRHAAYALASEGTTAAKEAFTLGVLCSMPCDWQARRRAELHMGNSEILGGLSIPEPGDDAISRRVAEIAARLAAVDDRFAGWASQAGVAVNSVESNEREDLLTELDACIAVLYGLNADDITVLYDTFGRPGQWDVRRDAVLAHHGRLSGEQP